MEKILMKEKVFTTDEQGEKTCRIFFVSSKNHEYSSKDFEKQEQIILKYISQLGRRSQDLNLIGYWRKRFPKEIELKRVSEGKIVGDLCIKDFIELGFRDFANYKDKEVIGAEDAMSLLKELDPIILHHLDSFYGNHYSGSLKANVLVSVDRPSGRFEYSDDYLEDSYNAKDGIFDDLIEDEVNDLFPLYHGNKFIAMMGNTLLLQRLLDNEVVIQRTLFDGERSFEHFEPNDSPIELMKQCVSNREMIDRQFKMMEKHFWNKKE